MDTKLARIAVDPRIMGGQPLIRDTRVTVAHILRHLGRGETTTEILNEYPQLALGDIHAAAAYAADVVSGETLLDVE